MPYVPVHQAQLGRGVRVPKRTQGSMDCGPRSWQMAIDARTSGRVRKGVRALRRRGGVSGPQPTNIHDAWRAIDGLGVDGRYTDLRYFRKRRMSAVKQAVRYGKPVQLAIDYGAWNDSQKRETGDPYFRGGHSVLVFGQRDRGHGVEWRLFDPLDDGRRAGIERGPRWVLRKHLVAAAVSLANGNRDGIWAGVIGGGHGWK